jgi:hypothetical protein
MRPTGTHLGQIVFECLERFLHLLLGQFLDFVNHVDSTLNPGKTRRKQAPYTVSASAIL